METIVERLLGTPSFLDFAFAFLYCIIGSTATIALDVRTRDKESAYTPDKFSWKFFIRDNRARMLTTAFFIYVFIRFYTELEGRPITDWTAFFIGFGIDGFVEKLKSLKVIPKAKTNGQ